MDFNRFQQNLNQSQQNEFEEFSTYNSDRLPMIFDQEANFIQGKQESNEESQSRRNDDDKDERYVSNRDYRRRRSSQSSNRRRTRSRSRGSSRSWSKDRDDKDRRSRSPYYRDYYKSSRRRSRSRSRSYEKDDEYYHCSRRSPRTDDDEHSSDGTSRYRSKMNVVVPPNCTIVLKGLPPTCDEAAVWDVIGRQGFAPKDVRVLKKKDTGQSRGFGFVEFVDVGEATRWMEFTQGQLQLDDRQYADLQYSINKAPASINSASASNSVLQRGGDWICSKCGTNNFKKRDQCFKCNIKRDESEALGGEGFNEIGVMPCDTLLLRSVPITCDEERILSCLKKLSSLDVRRIVVARNVENKQSRGYAYVEMNGISDAAQLLTTLTAVTKLNIDGREIFVSYSKLPLVSVLSGANLAQTVDSWPNQMGLASLNKSVTSHQAYGGTVMQTDVTNAAAAVAQSAIKKAQVMRHVAAQQVQAQMQAAAVSAATILVPGAALLLQQHQQILAAQALHEMAAVQLLQEQASLRGSVANPVPHSLGTVITPYGELPRYPPPDVNIYQYDHASGYYFDPTTGLYYDAKTQYYYNSETQQYLYWDASFQTYLPSPTEASKVQPATTAESADKAATNSTTAEGKSKDMKEKNKDEKTVKVKTAKEIQKDMEKWAKQMNQKKECKPVNAVAPAVATSSTESRHSATADAAFSVLEKTTGGFGSGLVSYDGGESDEETGMVSVSTVSKSYSPAVDDDDKAITDWDKLACLLCRRQFPSKDVLLKHQQFSDLHKKNLEERKRSNFHEPVDSDRSEVTLNLMGSQYRDRAKERRQKFGLDDKPQPNRLKEKYLESLGGSYDESANSGLKSDNIGNKLMKSMGWQEGQGLGRTNQGIVDPITQQRRAQGAGLGSSNAVVNAAPSSSYKEHVRAALRQKFYEQS